MQTVNVEIRKDQDLLGPINQVNEKKVENWFLIFFASFIRLLNFDLTVFVTSRNNEDCIIIY